MSSKQEWVEEVFKDQVGMKFKMNKLLFSGQSDFQKVEVYETESHGRVLLNDDCFMLTERDEFIYHEMIVHPAMFLHPNPKNVLIIGGGDGGTAREVLRHPNVENCVMVEIDAMVIEACKKFIPQTASALSDPRLELIIEDGVKYLAETSNKFDLILVDSTDPVGPAEPLFGPEFYSNIFRSLSDEGLVIAQGESPFYATEMQKTLMSVISGQFPIAMPYNFSNMCYPGGLWTFMMGSKKLHPLKDYSAGRLLESGLKMNYYSSDLHLASFALPQFMKNHLGSLIRSEPIL